MPDTRLKSKPYRLETLYKIKNKKSELVFFKRNDAQNDFNEKKHSRNIVLKSRQHGFTTDESVDSLDDVLFNKNFDSLFIAHQKEEALKIFDNKIIFSWNNFNSKLKTLWEIDKDRANTLKFGFGDGSFSSISVSLSGRSGTYNRVHITEFAKICKERPRDAKEIISGTIPAVPMNGRIDIESTAEGEHGIFYDMFWEAWNRGEPTRPTEFKAHFYGWQWDKDEIAEIIEVDKEMPAEFWKYQDDHNKMCDKYPGRYKKITDIELTYYFYKWLSLNKDWNLLHQEYPTTPEEAFVSSGDKYFDQIRIKEMMEKAVEGKRFDNNWRIYEEYNPRHYYALGADVSEGIGRDSSTIVILDFYYRRPKVVAIYYNENIEPDEFAYEIKTGHNLYGGCIVAPERNNNGIGTIVKLKDLIDVDKIYSVVTKDTATDKRTNKLGWLTNVITKPRMMADLKTVVANELIDIPSKQVLTELRTYVKSDIQKVKRTEEDTAHWDLVIALAIALQMKDEVSQMDSKIYQDSQNPQRDENIMRDIGDATRGITEEFNPYEEI